MHRLSAFFGAIKGKLDVRGSSCGFTLAELLIALAILGVIATFTIPKVLQSQQDDRNNAIAKETAAAIVAAYSNYQLNNPVSASTKFADLTPYLNYVRFSTSASDALDPHWAGGSSSCSGVNIGCLYLHNGSGIHYGTVIAFTGTASTNAVYFTVDPDGQDTTDGRGVQFWMYITGRLATRQTIVLGTTTTGGSFAPGAGADPPWLDW